ncbi:hypothetical protein WN943_021146 [Citrus x changshan-huyou]
MNSSRRGWVSDSGSDSTGGDQDAARRLDFGQFVSAAVGFRLPWFRLDSTERDEDGFVLWFGG